jgi:hypothetical protein
MSDEPELPPNVTIEPGYPDGVWARLGRDASLEEAFRIAAVAQATDLANVTKDNVLTVAQEIVDYWKNGPKITRGTVRAIKGSKADAE